MNCTYCDRETAKPCAVRRNDPLTRTRDHVIPLSKGGTNTASNRVISCLRCNSLKGDMMPDEWAAFMQANPGWWTQTKYERRVSRTFGRPLPIEHSRFILEHGKKAYKVWIGLSAQER